jgi:hypothetical protein
MQCENRDDGCSVMQFTRITGIDPALMDGLGARHATAHHCRSYLRGDSQLLMILLR